MKKILYLDMGRVKEWLIIIEEDDNHMINTKEGKFNTARLMLQDEYEAWKITVWDTNNHTYKVTKNRIGPHMNFFKKVDDDTHCKFLQILMS